MARLPAQRLGEIISAPPPTQWFGVYLAGRKIGHGSLSLENSEPDDAIAANAVVVESTMSIAMTPVATAGSSERRLEVRERHYYEKAPPHALVGISSVESSADARTETTYRRRGALLEIRTQKDGDSPRGRTVHASRETFAGAALSFIDPADVAAGDRFEHLELDADSGVDRRVTVRVAAVESRRLAGVETSLVKLQEQTEGDSSLTEIVLIGGGRVLGVTAGGFSFRAESRERARSNVVGFDYDASNVRVARKLGDPAAVAQLAIRLTSKGSFEVPGFPNQKVTRAGHRQQVTLTRGAGAIVSAAERSIYTAATRSLDWDTPAVSRAARDVVAGAETDTERARRLTSFVYGELDKDLATEIPTASAVLEQKRGDCTEHTVLFVALARAVGLPAREVSGLVYTGDDNQSFGWHAWAEVAIEGRWQRVDPSWDEPEANATHLTLALEGDSGWIALLGDVEIEVLEVNGERL